MIKGANTSLTMQSITIMTGLFCCLIILPTSTASIFDDKFHLVITNEMGPGWGLTARCTSNNNEEGEKELPHGGSMSMDLKDELFDRTQVACDFLGDRLGKKVSGHFKVFVEGETGYSCGEVCKYSAREDGLWFYDFRDAEWEFKGDWVRD